MLNFLLLMPKVKFIQCNGEEKIVEAQSGMTLLEITRQNDIELEGACEGSLACSTCHVVVNPEWYDKLPEATPEEDDMLDLAFGLTKTSRLGCQIILTEELDNLTVTIPEQTRNLSFKN
jgi:2Fe-2S ferredoxin